MAQAGTPKFGERPPGGPGGLDAHKIRLLLLKHNSSRREGSLAAALVQSMALAVISTAGAYPSWVLVTNSRQQVVLGASWAISQADPPRGSPVLGPTGGTLMLAIAFCCLCSVVSASSAIGLDFLGRRKCRRLAPMLHCLTALLITCTAALGSSLLGLVRGRAHAVPELLPLEFTASPGQSLFLSFLACALASTATGLSCSSPALVAPARSSRDVGRMQRRSSSRTDSEDSPAAASPQYVQWQDGHFFDPVDLESKSSSSQDDEEARRGRGEWYGYLLAQTPWRDRWWGRQSPPPPPPPPQQQPPPAVRTEEGPNLGERREPAAQEEERAMEKKFWEPRPLGQREVALVQFVEDAIHTRQPGEKETDQEDPGRGDAELQFSLEPEAQRVKSEEKPPSQISESQAAEAGLVESQDREKQDSPTIAI